MEKSIHQNIFSLLLEVSLCKSWKVILLFIGHPVKPKIEGSEHGITSDDAFFLEKLPKKVIIVGGGYIATEFACIFNGFGCEVTLVLRGKTILTPFDEGS